MFFANLEPKDSIERCPLLEGEMCTLANLRPCRSCRGEICGLCQLVSLGPLQMCPH